MRHRAEYNSADHGLIDIHCHRPLPSAGCKILSLDMHELAGQIDDEALEALALPLEDAGQHTYRQYFSLGIHPWFIGRQDWPSALQTLANVCNHPQLLAVGECGLDKCIATPIELQTQVFARQIKLAERFAKPLIIHCVKAFNELLQLKKAHQAGSIWIVHGFNAHPKLAEQLLKQGCYLSFGAALLNPRCQAESALAITPLDRLFLETDAADVPISEIYAAAAKILGLDAAALRQQIQSNFQRVFFHD